MSEPETFDIEVTVDSDSVIINTSEGCEVDWGDGIAEPYSGQTHEYKNPGDYVISFTWWSSV